MNEQKAIRVYEIELTDEQREGLTVGRPIPGWGRDRGMSKSRNERWTMDTSDLIDECEELEIANERLQAQVAALTAERDELWEAGQTIKGYYRDNWAWSGQATERKIAAACALLEEE